MGVRGLSSFVANQKSAFFSEITLRTQSVLIDGNNLRYALYNKTPNTNCYFGGDYDKYEARIREFFSACKTVGLTVILVMDGAYESFKKTTVLKRYEEKIHFSLDTTPLNGHRHHSVYPIWAKELFLRICSSLSNVLHIFQSVFEADSDLALLGNRLSLPIISNDSDFIVYPVDFILLDSLSWENIYEDENGKYILAKQFQKSKFMEIYNIQNTELMFLMASLLGNDYVLPSAFDQFISQIKKPKNKSLTTNHKKISGLLNWLSYKSSAPEAIETILSFISKTKREFLKTTILESMNLYRCSSSSSSIKSQSEISPFEVFFEISKERYSLQTSESKSISETLRSSLSSAHFPSLFAQILLNREFYSDTQVEESSKNSSVLSALPLIQFIVDYLHQKSSETVLMYYRVKRQFQKHIFISQTLPSLSNISHWKTVIGFDSNEESRITRNVPSKLRLLFYSLHYTIRNENSFIPSLYIKCILMYVLLRNVIDFHLGCKHRNPSKEPPNLSDEPLGNHFEFLDFEDSQNLSSKNLWNVSKKLLPFFRHMTPKNFLKSYDKSIVHNFNIFQSNLLYVSYVYRLLNLQENELPDMSYCWHGTFLYNLYCDLLEYRNRFERLQYLLDNEPFTLVFKNLVSVFESVHVPMEDPSGDRGRRNKKST